MNRDNTKQFKHFTYLPTISKLTSSLSVLLTVVSALLTNHGIGGHPEMPQPGTVSRHPLQEPNQASQVQPDGSWEASALLQLPVYDISTVPHGLQPQDCVWGHLREEKFNSRQMIFNSAGRPAGTDPSAGNFLSEKKKKKTPLISSLFYLLGDHWILAGFVIRAIWKYFFGFSVSANCGHIDEKIF